jgi:hypothetical protein
MILEQLVADRKINMTGADICGKILMVRRSCFWLSWLANINNILI